MWALDFTGAVVASTYPPPPRRRRRRNGHSTHTSKLNPKIDDQSLLPDTSKPESYSSPEPCSSPESCSGTINSTQSTSYFGAQASASTTTGYDSNTSDYYTQPIYWDSPNNQSINETIGFQAINPTATFNRYLGDGNIYQQNLGWESNQVSFPDVTYQAAQFTDLDIDHFINSAPDNPSVFTGDNQMPGPGLENGYGSASDRTTNGSWSDAYGLQPELQTSQLRYIDGNGDNLEWYVVNAGSTDQVPRHVQ